MEIRIIKDITIFDDFVKNSPYVHYMKTSMWAKVKKSQGFKAHYIGFYLNDELIGTALGLENNYLHSRYLYVPNGMCIDYENQELLVNCLNLLKAYAAKLHLTFLRIDPNVQRCPRDILGNQLPGFDHDNITQAIIANGFVHKGYNFAYDGSWYNRYSLAIDLSDDITNIKKRFNKQKINSLNRHQIIGLTTHIGNAQDLPYLSEFEKQLSSIQGFKPNKIAYFKNILDAFGKYARLYVTTLDIQTMIDGLQTELNSKKYAKDPEAKAAKEKELAKALQLKTQYKNNEIVIACGLFLFYGHKSWDLYTYNHKDFNYLKPVDNLHWFAINDLKANGVTFYDMCGFSGFTNKDDPHYGLYNYKRSFGSTFIENIGEFDMIYKPWQYKLFKKEKVLSYHFHHRINAMRYKQK
ncbi:MAG: aminoacyltransferase [Erysipelotrichaceae bacterium]|nr:aminoacyltransferase [Erysipelotrichaceae bacterium]MDY5251314.1 peptidoglycan bridge formation glycyltransferase FemA/FemB family protein [Erysipelotrichaceae bacterium]